MTSILEVEQLDTLSSNASSTLTIGGTNTTTIAFGPNVTTTPSSLANTPAFKVDKTSTQSISDGVWTKVTFTNEYYDTDSAFADSKFTVPSDKAGKYFFSAMLRCTADSGTADYYSLAFYKNGNIESIINQLQTADNQLRNSHIFASATFNLSVGQYIEVYANFGANNPVVGGSAEQSIASFFTGYRLIGA
jgi:hypothetical protein